MVALGEEVTVELGSTAGKEFKGFFVQARKISDDSIVGTFAPAAGSKQVDCAGPASAVTHSGTKLHK